MAGAGIAGPAVAIALRRAGIEAVVLEASPSPRDGAGVFLNLAPNGLHVLEALGLGHVLRGLGFRNDRLQFRNESGRVLTEVPVGGITLMRGDLGRALREAAEELGVRFEFGAPVEAVPREDVDVAVRLGDGSVREGSFLVGADGIQSKTRQQVFPDAPRPRYTGLVNIGGIAHTDLPPTGAVMHMVFGRRAFFGYAVRPSGETWWFSNVPQAEEPSHVTERTVDTAAWRDRLLALHEDDPPEVRQILGSSWVRLGVYAIHDLPPLRSWHRGRVALIGDAAHAIGPHVGQGASLALEDAFELARCLRDNGDPAVAFATFERLRRARVDAVLRQSRRTARQKMPGSWIGRTLRDLLLPALLRKGAESAAELYRYRPVWEDRAVA